MNDQNWVVAIAINQALKGDHSLINKILKESQQIVFSGIESKLGLHERLEVLYVVDGYEVRIYHESNDATLFEAKGETLLEAMVNLDKVCCL